MCRKIVLEEELKNLQPKSPILSKIRKYHAETEGNLLGKPIYFKKSDPAIPKLPQIPRNLAPINFPSKRGDLSPKPNFPSLSPPNSSPIIPDCLRASKNSTKYFNRQINIFKFRVEALPKKYRTRSLTPCTQKSPIKSSYEDLEYLINEYADDTKTKSALNNIIENWSPKLINHKRNETAVKSAANELKKKTEELMEMKKKSIRKMSEYIEEVIENIKLDC
ncbi:unnamed protein product [Blepharisma stoltei]|uniref:Uncharacterized protein n=1 Tax=Blepharisma stoltei TaxID=1481888 RepID=A0AAU9J644_9CILI|nr:unnamed protein product [Blepharisma stoltei]